MNKENLKRIKESTADSLTLSLLADIKLVEVQINDKTVYSQLGGIRNQESGIRYPHSGLHLVVLHPRDGRLLHRRRFLTHQPAEHENLARALNTIQPGRIVILLGVPEWVLFFGSTGSRALSELGFRGHKILSTGEAWVGVAVKGRMVVLETATTHQGQKYFANGINIDLIIPNNVDGGPRCSWYSSPRLKAQADFCERYEGYGDLCNCKSPFTYHQKPNAKKLDLTEQIPVAVITANKPYNLYRLLHQLLTIPGAGQTDILVVVDDYHEETLALVEVLNISCLVHIPEGVHNQRTNANVRFALYKIFAEHPNADKAIMLEDDLLVADDLISYFHQTAWLLDKDPSIFCVNAFSSYSIPDSASDVTKLLRVEAYPMYGWMVTREYALFIIRHWVQGTVGDWDWILMHENNRRGRDVVVPEVSRTFHAGAAGAHVDGFEQYLYFNRMITSQSPIYILLDNYLRNLRQELQRAKQISPDPRQRNFLPKDHPGPFSVYVRSGTKDDEYYSFRIFMMALRTYYWDTREIFRGVIRFRHNGKVLYVVGCPVAHLFCKYGPGSHGVLKPIVSLVKEVQAINDRYEQSLYEIVTTNKHGQDSRSIDQEPMIKTLM
ncbi:unnamed protein product, partial [Meganyctiphanes norvegica]